MGWEMEGLDEAQKKQWQENENARIASEVTDDFYRRREERRSIENCWILNLISLWTMVTVHTDALKKITLKDITVLNF